MSYFISKQEVLNACNTWIDTFMSQRILISISLCDIIEEFEQLENLALEINNSFLPVTQFVEQHKGKKNPIIEENYNDVLYKIKPIITVSFNMFEFKLQDRIKENLFRIKYEQLQNAKLAEIEFLIKQANNFLNICKRKHHNLEIKHIKQQLNESIFKLKEKLIVYMLFRDESMGKLELVKQQLKYIDIQYQDQFHNLLTRINYDTFFIHNLNKLKNFSIDRNKDYQSNLSQFRIIHMGEFKEFLELFFSTDIRKSNNNKTIII